MNQELIQSITSVFQSINQAIWIVTTQHNGQRSGLTATWIHQASIDRENPTVLIGLAPNHFTCEVLNQSLNCTIHLLHLDQADLAFRFARPSSRNHDKFATVDALGSYSIESKDDSDQSLQTIPWLPSCHTALACRTFHSFDAGDRIYFLAEITNVLAYSDGPFLRESDLFSNLTPEQLAMLKTDLADDVSLQRPMLADWLAHLKSQ